MVDVRIRPCAYNGCSKRRSYGTQGSRKAEFCSEHKKAGMVDVTAKWCGHQGCYKRPSFGSEGSKKTELCSEHKTAGMVDVRNIRCAYHGCFKRPSFGTEGSRKMLFCSEHKTAGMVDVISKRCAYNNCPKRPSYGTKGGRKMEFCGEHKRAGMVNVRSKRWAYQERSKIPAFGTEGSNKAGFRSEHKTAGVVCVVTKRCAYHGCPNQPSYGRVGTTKAAFCTEHKRAGMFDGSKKRCGSEGCFKYGVYGPDGSRRQRFLCSRHFTEGHYAGASPVEAAKSSEEDKEMGEETRGLIDLPKTRKRPLRVERFSLQGKKTPGSVDCGSSRRKRMRVVEREGRGASQEAQQVSLSVRELSPTPSPTRFTPLASQSSSDQCQATQNLGRDDRSTSRARRLSTRLGCRSHGVPDLAPDPCVAASNPAHMMPTQGAVGANTGERKATGPKRDTGSGGDGLRCGGGGDKVETGDGDALITPPCAGAERDVSTTSSKGCCHTRASCAFALEGRCKIASLEQEKQEAVVEAKNLRDKVVQLEKQVADAAVGRAHAVAEATGKVEEEYTESFQALRAELTATSTGWENTRDDLKQIRQERDALHKEAQTRKVVSTTAPGHAVTASLLQSLMAGLATIASPAALVAAAAAAQSAGGAPAAELPTPATAPPPRSVAHAVMEEGEVDDNMGVCELKNEGAEEGTVSPVRCLDRTMVAIKPEV